MANFDYRMRNVRPGRIGVVPPILAALLALTPVSFCAQSAAAKLRPFQVDDVFALRQLGNYMGPIEFSPDGQDLAFVIQRPMPVKRPLFQIMGNERADIYVASSSGGAATNITKGEADGSGYWAPNWSPDGKRLSMLSTRSGALGLWVWERGSDSLRRMTQRDVDLYPTLIDISKRPFMWLSPTQLLASLMPAGKTFDAFKGEWRGGDKKAAINWQRTWAGEEISVSVLVSGLKPDQRPPPATELTIIDINTGETRVVGRGPIANFSVEPNGKLLAYARRVALFQPEAERPLPFVDLVLHDKFELKVVSLERTNRSATVRSASDVVPTSLGWSPDGRELAFLAYTADRIAGPQLYRLDVGTVTTSVRSDSKTSELLNVTGYRLHWTPHGWLVLGSARGGVVSSAEARRDWWLARQDGSLRCATQSMSVVPPELWLEAGKDSFVAVADGKLWRISGELAPEKLLANFDKRIVSIIWPSRDGTVAKIAARDDSYGVIAVAVLEGATRYFYSVNLARRSASLMRPPALGSTIVGYAPRSQAVAYYLSDPTGLRLWASWSIGGRSVLVFETNTFLQGVAGAEVETFHYKSLDGDGESLIAWLLLPVGYQRGKRYPLVVWPYPGYVAGTSPSIASNTNYVNFLNLQILAAKGYAVLRPSTPLNPIGQPDDMLLKVKATVLPAVDKAIELGIADSGRTYLLGHSYGGYAVYGLVSQVDRFKAAIAINGYTNLISAYGEFHFGRRYEDDPLESQRWMQAAIEVSMHLGAPPWQDLERYIRNSPIFFVNRVQTPLLIIHSDLDAAPIEQAEEFFNSLFRQGKPAKFVRYWGEGHNLQSLPNIRNVWDHILDWLEGHR